jgi:hypothetical protein
LPIPGSPRSTKHRCFAISVELNRFREHYRKLNYPGIAEDLRPYIVDRSKGVVVRRAAIDIAEECPEALQMQTILVELAMNPTEVFQVR